MPNNTKWHVVIPGYISNEQMNCKVSYFPDTIAAIPTGPAPYTGSICTYGANSEDYEQYKSIYNNGVPDYLAGCSTM
jgi:hypothetical protein